MICGHSGGINETHVTEEHGEICDACQRQIQQDD